MQVAKQSKINWSTQTTLWYKSHPHGAVVAFIFDQGMRNFLLSMKHLGY